MSTSILQYLDPTYWFGSATYSHWWINAFHTFLFGFGAKAISLVLLFLGFWLLARRESIPGFILSVISSFFFAYIGGILHFL